MVSKEGVLSFLQCSAYVSIVVENKAHSTDTSSRISLQRDRAAERIWVLEKRSPSM